MEKSSMIKIEEMSKTITFFEQMEQECGPVVIINRITVNPEETDELLRVWATDIEIMKGQPGYISAQLHRGVGGNSVFLNYSVWESVGHLKQAFNRPEFQVTLNDYPPSAVASPHIFEKIDIPGGYASK